ncbi:flavoprotein [Tamaricihabitans halophyticus]|uniref:Flavoprotein n=1 Tax=Tamaricihabitans halophyticus TaxID=1262583 RepID=A0A4R2QMG7_9PSEU|nr:flavoprotein [Tamaricihabitans halophyticus]
MAVTLTPTAATWLRASGDLARIEAATGLPVRSQARLPIQVSPHPPIDCFAVAPASANTVAKLAVGIADNQALTSVSEAIGSGDPPIVVFPRINTAHAQHPAWPGHVATLRGAGVRVLIGEDIWPLPQPRAIPSHDVAWSRIIDAIVSTRQARQ